MTTTISKMAKAEIELGELADLRDVLLKEKRRLEQLLMRAERLLQQTQRAKGEPNEEATAPRRSPLDDLKKVVTATKDLRVTNGNLSAERIAKLYGINLSDLARWLGRTKQAVSKTPDADSLQNALSYFERVARLRLIMENDAEFRKWLRMPHPDVAGKNPLELMAKGEWQAVADFVDDILAGTPG